MAIPHLFDSLIVIEDMEERTKKKPVARPYVVWGRLCVPDSGKSGTGELSRSFGSLSASLNLLGRRGGSRVLGLGTPQGGVEHRSGQERPQGDDGNPAKLHGDPLRSNPFLQTRNELAFRPGKNARLMPSQGLDQTELDNLTQILCILHDVTSAGDWPS